MLSFGKSDSTAHLHEINLSSPLVLESSNVEKIHEVFGYVKLSKRSSRRTCLQSADHVLAERKRRGLSSKIIDLSTVVPGLLKLDKLSTIIEGAFKYIKDFQEDKKRILEEYSAVTSKKSRLSSLDDTTSSEENLDSSAEQSPLNIDINTAGDDVVFVIRCREHKGIIDEISGEVEKHHLRVITNCSMESGNGELMDVGFSLTIGDPATNIRTTLLNLM
ncbi:transcription factor NAI1-like [Coffea arabica]|uniref:Transcription factor NAI1-like n=1 Tax=Coffea arabica TaxID=13443 RepID=A0ABM4V998_COFAR